MERKIIVKTNQLSKRYGNYLAANQVNMNIYEGDIYGFVGENGAGKTTIIRLISGLIYPTSGSFQLLDQEGRKPLVNLEKGTMSAIVETPSLALNLTAENNLIAQCLLLGIDKSHVDEILEKVGLEKERIKNKKVKNFSLGMRQRLAMGISLLGNPKFIILDEPMNGLDPHGIVEMRDLIHSLNKNEGITFLISSHNLLELAKVATVYGFISRGKLIEEITIKELDEKCRSHIAIEVSGKGDIKDALKELAINDYQLEKDMIKIYHPISITKLVKVFDEHGFEVINLYKNNANIENYYLDLIGGKINA